MWIESEPFKLDFQPLEGDYGNFWTNNGNVCMHGNVFRGNPVKSPGRPLDTEDRPADRRTTGNFATSQEGRHKLGRDNELRGSRKVWCRWGVRWSVPCVRGSIRCP